MSVPGAVQDLDRLETAEITVDSDGTPVPAYLARPRDGAVRPGIIVVHDAFGLGEHTRDVTRRFANAGFDALAPDLYSRTGAPDPEGGPTSLFGAMSRLEDATVVSDLDASAAHLRSLDGGNGKVGVVGFCMGGRCTLLFAFSSDRVDAAIPCWGGFIDRALPDAERTPQRPTPVVELAGNLHCPLLLVGGAEDQNPSPQLLTELDGRLRGMGKDVRLEIFANAGHAFFHDGRPNYRDEAAQKLWPIMLEFFAAHLR
ncbi:MAG TPA: dienelactone hydrolase family protein [Candidatus Angelobacter sp.]|jgi:carboxymethylenebutenolidase|nr:dienelactone hydrolase family protein [Candidatus Angelobacter sp.]